MVRRWYGAGVDFSTPYSLQIVRSGLPSRWKAWECAPLFTTFAARRTYGFSFGFFHISIR